MNRRTFLKTLVGAALAWKAGVFKPDPKLSLNGVRWVTDPFPLRFVFKEGAYKLIDPFLEDARYSMPNPAYQASTHQADVGYREDGETIIVMRERTIEPVRKKKMLQ